MDDPAGCVSDTDSERTNEESSVALSDLPAEVLLSIFSFLDPRSSIAMCKTSRFFYRVTPTLDPRNYDEETMWVFLNAVELYHKYTENMYACRKCLRLLPKVYYSFSTKIGQHFKTHRWMQYSREKQCMPCRYPHYRTPGSSWNDDLSRIVVCLGCVQLRRDACTNCRVCRSCMYEGSCRGWNGTRLRQEFPLDFTKAEDGHLWGDREELQQPGAGGDGLGAQQNQVAA